MKIKNLFLSLFFLVILIGFVSSISNESIQSKNLLIKANQSIFEMQERNISVNRVNESYQEALGLFSSQQILEKLNKKTNYPLVNQYCEEVISVKEMAFKSQDELIIFLDEYNSASNKINLSGMDEEYLDIIKSFDEERFEDTEELINIGYDKLSELQASQTATKLFYESITNKIKDFFVKNWLTLIIIFIVVLILFIIFRIAIKEFFLRRKIKNLNLQKETIDVLIKRLQKSYFKIKNISSSEYETKLNKFNNMILDINRKIPLLRKSLIKLKKN